MWWLCYNPITPVARQEPEAGDCLGQLTQACAVANNKETLLQITQKAGTPTRVCPLVFCGVPWHMCMEILTHVGAQRHILISSKISWVYQDKDIIKRHFKSPNMILILLLSCIVFLEACIERFNWITDWLTFFLTAFHFLFSWTVGCPR